MPQAQNGPPAAPTEPPGMAATDRLLSMIGAMTLHQSHSFGPALKKPLLVLLLATIIERDRTHGRRFVLSELKVELSDLIARFGGRPDASGTHPEQPFYHLGSEPFWTCAISTPRPSRGRTPSPSAIDYGELSEEAYAVLSNAQERARVVDDVLARWWAPTERTSLCAALGIGA